MSQVQAKRLFFALWPDEALREGLARLARKALRKSGKLVAPENLHLTLVFLGSVSAERMACVEEAANGVTGEPFTLRLDELGHWPRPRVAWTGATEMPPALPALARELQVGLVRCGFTPEKRPFRAHLTLARKVGGRIPTAAHPPLSWSVAAFHLVESITHPAGAQYHVLRSWPLGTASTERPQ